MKAKRAKRGMPERDVLQAIIMVQRVAVYEDDALCQVAVVGLTSTADMKFRTLIFSPHRPPRHNAASRS
jgi:hypothetical protein